MATASSRMKVSESETDPVVSRAVIDSKEVNGEKVPGLDPFVAYEHAYRNGVEYDVTEGGGIELLYSPDYSEEDPTQEKWGFSIRVEVMEKSDSYVEVRYSPKVENHRGGKRIWKDIIDTLEDRTVKYHRDIKGELHD